MTRAPERSTADVVIDAGDPTEPIGPPSPGPRQRRGGRAAVIAVASVALIVVAAVAFSIGRLSTLAEPTPTTTSAEAGFARDMQVHHLQGVELAMIVRDATDDDEVRLLGYDIATTQAQQAGQMYGWLAEWGLSQAGSEPSMTWMTRPALDGAAGHGDHATSDPGAHVPGAPMPGLATPAQVEELRGLTGVEAERRFLELMIAHHQGAVEMADAVLARSTNDVVVALAQSIVDSQTSEIELMTGMLAERS
ncbi:uncharacterized protein (DUF305 family) [Agromyces hippuratus]|uniref:Uncharacterized protein (DUF305 family) n=1 Tax=Agromyces hippuratus TaxID=286438 RepID=A0A852X8U2_9MICO|nr:DUF305 domain-containing protein [Agromyces hippuratus]NYG22305.1 uncharacterized protein (DUF305 family) [Agromyces hippuratus]